MHSYTQLLQEKLEIEKVISHNAKLLHRVPNSNQKLIDHLIDEIEILKIDLRHINEDIEKLT